MDVRPCIQTGCTGSIWIIDICILEICVSHFDDLSPVLPFLLESQGQTPYLYSIWLIYLVTDAHILKMPVKVVLKSHIF